MLVTPLPAEGILSIAPVGERDRRPNRKFDDSKAAPNAVAASKDYRHHPCHRADDALMAKRVIYFVQCDKLSERRGGPLAAIFCAMSQKLEKTCRSRALDVYQPFE